MTKEQWQIYLNELYRWAQDKYNALLKGEISEEEYYKVLEFYETETQVITFLIKDELEYLEPKEIEEIINSFESVKNVKSLRELIEKRFSMSKSQVEEQKTVLEGPSIHNIPRPPTISSYAKEIDMNVFSEEEKESSGFADRQNRVESSSEVISHEESFSSVSSLSNPKNVKEITVVLVGERSVGRSTFLNLLGAMDGKFEYDENDTHYVISFIDKDHEIYFPERRELIGSNGAIAFYDITRPDTVFRLEKWLKKIYRDKGFTLPILFVGNKTDLSRLRIVTIEKAEELVSMVRGFENYCDYIEVSLKLEQSEAAINIVSKLIKVMKGLT